MLLNAYLHFPGTCEEAFKFYAGVLGGEIEMMMTHEDAPMDVPVEWRGKIMHATMRLGDETLMGADAQPGHYQAPAGFAVSVGLNDPARAEEIFDALAAGGNVRMALQKTFWARAFGMCTDRYGTPWMINCE